MKKFPSCIRLAVLFLFLSIAPLQAEDSPLTITPDMQFDYARTLFTEKDYATAIVEFKRFIHFFPNHPKVHTARFHTAKALFYKGEFQAAAKAFNEIILQDADPELTQEAYFYQSDAFLNLGNTGYAQIVLQNSLQLTEKTETKDRIYFKLGSIHLILAREGRHASLATAKTYFSKISEPGQIRFNTDAFIHLIETAQNAPQKNPTAAGLFAVVPGGGFLYTERYKDALASFLLNTGLIVAAWQAYDDGNEALAGVIGFVGTGFYSGNIYGSITSAHKYNKKRVADILGRHITIAPKIDAKNQSYSVSLKYRF